MLKNSLLEILRTFSKEEITKFADFVRSPYHNKIANAAKLYAIIKKHAPEFASDELEKERVWTKLFPHKKYNYGIMKNLIHDLTKLAEEFIVLEYYKSNELKKYYELTDVLFERKIHKVFTSKMSLMDKTVKKNFLKNDQNTIEEDFFLLFNIYGVKLSSLHMLGGKFDFKKDVETASELMISCFLIYFFKLYCNLTVFNEKDKKISNENILQTFLRMLGEKGIDEILNYSEKPQAEHLKIMNAYFRMFRTIGADNSETSYQLLKESIHNIQELAGGNYLFDLFINLENSLMTLKKSKLNVIQEHHEIFNMRIESNSLLDSGGMLGKNVFIRYVLCALSLKKPDDIEHFTDKFLYKIHIDSRETCFNFAMASKHFALSEYNKSLEYLSKINTDTSTWKLAVKDLQIMNFYELNDYESFIYVMDTYKHFLKYKNKPLLLHPFTHQFSMKVKALFDLKENPDSYKFVKLQEDEGGCLFSSKIWLDQKIEELKKGMGL